MRGAVSVRRGGEEGRRRGGRKGREGEGRGRGEWERRAGGKVGLERTRVKSVLRKEGGGQRAREQMKEKRLV